MSWVQCCVLWCNKNIFNAKSYFFCKSRVYLWLLYINIKSHYYILYYGIVACDFISRSYPSVLRQILVFVRRFIRVPFLMVHFFSPISSDPLLSSQVGSYRFASSRLSVRGGCMKLEVWVDCIEWVHVCVRNVILAQNNYFSKPNPNPNPNAHSGYWVRNVLESQSPCSTM